MGEKLPYYMVYPMPFIYDEERLEQRDYEYMRSLYPDMAKRVLPYVEEECDRCEGPCSMLYDEYPDRLQLRLMCRRIYNNVCANERIFCGMETEGLREESEKKTLRGQENADRKRKTAQRERHDPPSGEQDWLNNLIQVMLYQELYRRRRDDRRMKQRFY